MHVNITTNVLTLKSDTAIQKYNERQTTTNEGPYILEHPRNPSLLETNYKRRMFS